MANIPETPEGVALVLLQTLLAERQTLPPKTEVLNLYCDCLNAAFGFRPNNAGRAMASLARH